MFAGGDCQIKRRIERIEGVKKVENVIHIFYLFCMLPFFLLRQYVGCPSGISCVEFLAIAVMKTTFDEVLDSVWVLFHGRH